MKRRRLKFAILTLVILATLAASVPTIARIWVHRVSRDRLYSRIDDVPRCRVAIVLGAKVYPSGLLSSSLRDRVDAGIDLYKAGKVRKLLMSGDNRFKHYDEPTRMMEYAVKHGVKSEDIKMDYAGRRTYDSVYRAKHIFGLNEFIIVSQSYHLERAIFLSKHLGVDAYGFCADKSDDFMARHRESQARVLALLDVYLLHPKPMMGKHETI